MFFWYLIETLLSTLCIHMYTLYIAHVALTNPEQKLLLFLLTDKEIKGQKD